MINLFDISNQKPVPSQHCYLIPQLKRIMDTFPQDYLEVYSYIFYLTCPDSTMNIYCNKPEMDRETIILSDLKPKFDIEDPIITSTIDWCKGMYETPTLRAFLGAKKALDRVADYLADTEITDGKDGSAMTIDRYMSKLSDFRKAYKDAESDLQEEQAKVRGAAYLRYDMRPGYVDMKAEKEDDHV